MQNKSFKLVIRIVFISVFLLTIFLGALILLNQPNDDILNNEMDFVIAVIMLSPALIVEIEIYSICFYGLTKKKNKRVTFFKIFSLAMALLFCGFFVSMFYTTTNKIETILLVIFLLYVLSKLLPLAFQRKIQNSESC